MKTGVFIYGIVSILLISCENYIEGPDDIVRPDDIRMHSTLASIQNELFNKSCALSGCHGGSRQPNLSEGQSYKNLVNVPSIESNTLFRVKPFESENSFLIRKLTAESTSIMPPSGQLSQPVIDSVIAWIDNGALNN
jgi:hypothetical protein